MRTVVIGTAGHIDHGKSALVKALTGTDPDRLKEEQERGITIDLGFAHLTTGAAQMAFVDVPGHERFVRNMLAGAGGIDAVLLVIDAGESVMPQTREHFEICRLLGIERGVIAVTKVDLADARGVLRTREAAADLVAGSFLEGAPILGVSARTGEGLDALRAALEALAGHAARQHRAGVVRLPIDRVFTVKGFGAVVTGTLVSGEVAAGDSLDVLPQGRAVRVRGLQVHGRPADGVRAPQRAAVNLSGIDARELHRGMTLSSPGALAVTTRADVWLQLLAGARPMKHGARVRVHQGASEIFARVSIAATRAHGGEAWTAASPGDAGVVVPAGGEAFARLRFETPAALTRGDRLILRASSPPVTIGGARVLDPEPGPAGVRRAAALARFSRLSEAGAPVPLLLDEAGGRGLAAGDLVRRAGLGPGPAEETLSALERSPRAVRVGDRVVAAGTVEALESRVEVELAAYHAAHPADSGMPRALLRERIAPRSGDALFGAVLTRLTTRGIVRGTDRVALAGHQPAATSEDARLQAQLEAAMRDGGLTPPEAEVLASSLKAPLARVEQALQVLVREKRLIRAGDLVFHCDALAGLRADVAAMRAGQPAGARVTLDVAAFKARFRLTRKHAIPLLEWLDRERVTRRVGEGRIVL